MAKRLLVLALTAFAAAPLSAQTLNLRVGGRYGSIMQGAFANVSLSAGPVSFFGYGFTGAPETFNQIMTGVSVDLRPFTLQVFAYKNGHGWTGNGAVGLHTARTDITLNLFALGESGNVQVSHRIGRAVYVSAMADLRRGDQARGQVEVSVPLSVRLGRKREPRVVGPAGGGVQRIQAVSLGEITGRLEAEGQPLPGIALVVGDFQVTTDAEGRFSIPNVPVGAYRPRAVNLPIWYTLSGAEVIVKPGRNSVIIRAVPKEAL